ncbi:MAG: hypothetical protein ABL903_07485 [Methylococcales bacterium]
MKDITSAINLLWTRSAPHLRIDELKDLCFCSEMAEEAADNLAQVMMGIGCLVHDDKESGSFQSAYTAATLLWNLAHQVQTIQALIAVGSNADDTLKRHKDYLAILAKAPGEPPKPKEELFDKNQKAALKTLERLYEEFRLNLTGEGKDPNDAKVPFSFWREETGLALGSFDKVRDGLLKAGFITLNDGFVYLN